MISIKNVKFSNLILLIFFLFIFLIPINLTFFTLDKNNTVVKNDTPLEINDLKLSGVSGKISIVGEQGWIDFKDDGNCTGSGTYYDPYVIKDLVIDGGGSVSGIVINNSKKTFFRIENCTIFDCGYGIQLDKSCNGTLLNNNCSNNYIGIYLDGWTDKSHFTYEEYLTFICMNNTLVNNIANNNSLYGIYMRRAWNNTVVNNVADYNKYGLNMIYISDGNTIIDNSFKKNEMHGIYIEGPCMGNILRGNYMKGCGFYSDYSCFLSNTVDATNLVNDGSLYFYGNSTSLNSDDFSNAGQIYLLNCNNSLISGHNLSDGSVSISLIKCNNIEISSNNLSSNSLYGIDLLNCTKISIVGNEINKNRIGIEARNVNHSIILENEVSFNLIEGIYMSKLNNNSISKNNINSNGFRAGIRMFGYCSNNTFSNNRFKDNLYEGLSFALYSSNNTITGNVFNGNRIGVYSDISCANNAFYLNFFINSEESHISGTIHITNTWNTTDIGNYWDNYTGSDNDGDGIGDIPHIVDYSSLILDCLPIVDNNPPIITIIKPINNSNIGSLAPSFNIRVEEKYLDVMWYTLDGSLNNYTFTENGTINQGAWDALNYGQITIRFYAVDKIGYISFMDVVVVKKIQETELIPGYYLFVLFCVISIIGATLIVIRRKSYSLEGLKKSYKKF